MPRYDDDDRPRKRRPRDEDDRPRSRRRPRDDEDDDRPRTRRVEEFEQYAPSRRKKAPRKQVSALGGVAFGIGALALLVSFMPCFASKALIPAGIAIIVGFIALVLAQRSEGRQGYGMPIAALSISAVAVVVAVGWLFLGKQIRKEMGKEWQGAEERYEREEAAREKERAKAPAEVKAADPGEVVRVSSAEFYRAYEDDEDRADRFYKNKVVEVTGVFHEVNFGAGDFYVVMLRGGPQEFEFVGCQFAKDPDTRARLAQLQPGQTVTIRGKCLGGGSDLEACILVN
jgi:hypothetical protein